MSYTKLTDTPDVTSALGTLLAQAKIVEPVAADLLAAGSVVQLETGRKVWVSCVVHDRPETPQTDLITVAIALEADAPWIKPNGQVVGVAWWCQLWPAVLASLTIDVARKACMMIALGEPQPQVPIPNPEPLPAPQEQDAIKLADTSALCIRTVMLVATEISQLPADVL